MTEHELLQIAEHVERWYDEQEGVGNPTGTFAEYIGRLLSHIGSQDAYIADLEDALRNANPMSVFEPVERVPLQ